MLLCSIKSRDLDHWCHSNVFLKWNALWRNVVVTSFRSNKYSSRDGASAELSRSRHSRGRGIPVGTSTLQWGRDNSRATWSTCSCIIEDSLRKTRRTWIPAWKEYCVHSHREKYKYFQNEWDKDLSECVRQEIHVFADWFLPQGWSHQGIHDTMSPPRRWCVLDRVY